MIQNTRYLSQQLKMMNQKTYKDLSGFDSDLVALLSDISDSKISSALNYYLNASNDCKFELEQLQRRLKFR